MEFDQTKLIFLVLAGVLVVIICIAVPLGIMSSDPPRKDGGNGTSIKGTSINGTGGSSGMKEIIPRDMIFNVTIHEKYLGVRYIDLSYQAHSCKQENQS